MSICCPGRYFLLPVLKWREHVTFSHSPTHLGTLWQKKTHMSSNIHIKKNCLCCGNEFTAHTLITRYCSHTCNSKHYKQLKREEKIQEQSSQQKSEQNLGSKIAPFDQSIQIKQFLSIEEVASLLGACRRTIQRQIANGTIKAKKLGSRSIIQRSEIDNLFK